MLTLEDGFPELFVSFALTHLLLEHGGTSLLRMQISLPSGNQGNVYPILNQKL